LENRPAVQRVFCLRREVFFCLTNIKIKTMDIFDWIWANLPFKEFLNPDKRIYWLYMLLSLVYALIFIIFSRKNLQNKYFSTWFSKSARIDFLSSDRNAVQ
jgi:hypothetical protein